MQKDRKRNGPEYLHQVVARGRPQPGHHALHPADALRRRGNGRDEQVLLLQVNPSGQRGGGSERAGLQREVITTPRFCEGVFVIL